MQFQEGQRLHFVGIGGTGLSAIARVLLERGFAVSGSDRALNTQTDALERDGAVVFKGHDAANISGADLLIVSSAVRDANPEVAAAKAAGIPVYKRKDILPALLHGKHTIAVAGTHGKTTTTAMIVHILNMTGHQPGYIVGSVMANTSTNAAAGDSPYFVIEADEYDDMFLGLTPRIAVVTSAEWDHPDFFPDEAALLRSFRALIGQIEPETGTLIISGDDWRTRALATARADIRIVTYGYDRTNSVFIHGLRVDAGGTMRFGVYAKEPLPTLKAQFALGVVGRHNAANAVAASLAAEAAGVPMDESARALASFQSTGRRFEVRGEADGVIVIDDYGHHPTAIRATLEAARMRYPDRQIWAVWQPHTYSRTRALMSEYARSFANADHVLVTDVYAARELPEVGLDAKRVTKAIKQHHPDAAYSGDLESTAERLLKRVRRGAVVLIFSAGDGPKVGEMLLAGKRSSQ